ncbi:MAG: inorganic phosphate transporter [Candidatus Bathyarchaeia archaeon]
MIFEVLLVILVFLAVALVAGNNLSACVGPAVGARIISKRTGALLGLAGFSAGLIIQGSGMARSVAVLLPNPSIELQVAALLSATVIFGVAHLARVPLSLSMSLVGLLAGLSFSQGITTSLTYMSQVASMWFVAPAVAALISFYMMRIINKRKVTDIWRRIRFYKALLIVLSFTTAFGLGANTLGLIVATAGFNVITVAVAVAAIFLGTFFLAEGSIRRMSQEFYLMRYSNAVVTLATSTILVEIAAFLNIPLSNTQTTAAAVFGTGVSYKAKFMSLKPFLVIVAGWVLAPLISFLIGWII